jgi:hypothetical protein
MFTNVFIWGIPCRWLASLTGGGEEIWKNEHARSQVMELRVVASLVSVHSEVCERSCRQAVGSKTSEM